MNPVPSILEEMIMAEAPSVEAMISPLLGPTIGPILNEALPVAMSFLEQLQSGKITGAGTLIPDALTAASNIAITVGAAIANPLVVLVAGGVRLGVEIYELIVDPAKLGLPQSQAVVAAQTSEALAKNGKAVPAHLVNTAVALAQATQKKAA